ncbi:RelA/SpoT domain protein [uncultured spirochete]|jgi:putative GTP pyrophosphokinase|uniref:RelA/SpoT domain protein n=1 Tax=uncultured spirochete TaxID=156406 RepID=A0A3P3XTS7_9SPIR|nr:RelA/SpoT domain protein [uncultured spirochete]
MSDIENIPNKALLSDIYIKNRANYEEALAKTIRDISKLLQRKGIHPTIKSRVKDFESYFAKKIKVLKNAWDEHKDPLPINDVLAMRIICPFLRDLDEVEATIAKHYDIVEIERKGQDRSFREFGYESIHVLIRIPDEILPLCAGLERNVIEIQLRTILQEAWAEVEHELVYKAEFTPFDEPLKRKLAALNATLTLSDIIFQEILDYQNKLNNALKKRREAFYGKIEQTSAQVFGITESLSGELPSPVRQKKVPAKTGLSAKQGQVQNRWAGLDIDTLLLSALDAHNASDFKTAIAIYTEILSRKPEAAIAAVVFKHRGMAYFAQSEYPDALADFTSCLMLDPDCYKALYYRGVVKSIQDELRQAIDDFTKALEIHPYHFFSRYRRALCWWQLGDYVQAHADCEIALRIKPENKLAQELQKKIQENIVKEEI